MVDLNGARVLIVSARYYEAIVTEAEAGARAALDAAGCAVDVVEAPGAFDLPGAGAAAYRAGAAYDAYIALGCVIRGETSHYDHVCDAVAKGIMDLTIDPGLIVGFGVLTVENQAQAWARARRDGKDKGGEAARAVLAMLGLRRADFKTEAAA